MGVAVGLILIAFGAILTWAVDADANGLNITAVGVILLVLGILVVLLDLLWWRTLDVVLRRPALAANDVRAATPGYAGQPVQPVQPGGAEAARRRRRGRRWPARGRPRPNGIIISTCVGFPHRADAGEAADPARARRSRRHRRDHRAAAADAREAGASSRSLQFHR